MCRNEMIRIVLILLMSVSYAVSDNCVRYTFEQNYEEWLNQSGDSSCHNLHPDWIEDKYSNIDLSAENDQSTTFIRPTDVYSCVPSFNFTMHYNGKIEVNIYMEKDERSRNFIDVFAHSIDGYLLGIEFNDNSFPNFKSGWHTLTIPLQREGSYEGFIFIAGRASPNSIVLVDSFRYIPPNMDENDCRLYEDEITTLQPSTAEPITPEPSTPEPNTPEPSTPEPSTPKPTTSEPSTPEPNTPEPSTPKPSTPEPNTPEPNTPKPSTPEPSTPGPSMPEPTTLAPFETEDSKGFWAPFSFNFSFNFTTFIRT